MLRLTLAIALTAPLFASEPYTTTPIRHVVVIFGENISFDQYFGTYPNATNPAGEPSFTAARDTPSVNGLTPELLTNNSKTRCRPTSKTESKQEFETYLLLLNPRF